MDDKMNRRGQMAIFVIIAIAIVVAIIAFFAIYRPIVDRGGADSWSPEGFMSKCMRDSVRDKLDVMLPQGGILNPTDYVVFNDINVVYLCKNINYYESCITQYPAFVSKLESELEENIHEEIESCFVSLESELESRNYDVSGGEVRVDVELLPGKVNMVTYRDFSTEKDGATQTYSSFSSALRSSIYDLGYLASEIASQEAEFCYFEYVGYMALYPEIDVRKTVRDDSTKIYTLTDKKSGEEMNLAVRGCAIPAGF